MRVSGPWSPDTVDGSPVGRRVVLGLLGVGAVGVVVGRRLSETTATAVSAVAPALGDVLPAAGGFRIYTVTSGYPGIADADYRLTIRDGQRTRSLTLADLQRMPQSQITKDFQCVTGWRVADVKWTGLLLGDLLQSAGIELRGRPLELTSYDGAYTESLTADQALRGDMMVALTLNGEPLSQAHGGPARLVVAPMYGYKSIKWLQEIRVTGEVQPGYWEERGYDIDAWVGDSNGRSDAPVE